MDINGQIQARLIYLRYRLHSEKRGRINFVHRPTHINRKILRNISNISPSCDTYLHYKFQTLLTLLFRPCILSLLS
jgi:hypothetical protein